VATVLGPIDFARILSPVRSIKVNLVKVLPISIKIVYGVK
jgi:hypothetical protein